jgi:hypothetical protein
LIEEEGGRQSACLQADLDDIRNGFNTLSPEA